MGKTTSRRRRRATHLGIPANAVVVPNVPEDDYYSQIPGVYYHFTKLEWRATCRDPFNNSKRSQRTFGVKKYGFYEAKLRAEVAAYEWDKHRQLVSFLQTVTTDADTKPMPVVPIAPPNSPYDSPYFSYGYDILLPGGAGYTLDVQSVLKAYYNNGTGFDFL